MRRIHSGPWPRQRTWTPRPPPPCPPALRSPRTSSRSDRRSSPGRPQTRATARRRGAGSRATASWSGGNDHPRGTSQSRPSPRSACPGTRPRGRGGASVPRLDARRHHRGHDPAGQHAGQGGRQHHGDQERIRVTRQADLCRDEQLAQDPDRLDGERAPGQDGRRPADRPTDRREGSVACSDAPGSSPGASVTRPPAGVGRRAPPTPPRGTTQRCARSPRRTARSSRSRGRRAPA